MSPAPKKPDAESTEAEDAKVEAAQGTADDADAHFEEPQEGEPAAGAPEPAAEVPETATPEAEGAPGASSEADAPATKPARTRRRRGGGGGNAQPEPAPKPAKRRASQPTVVVRAQAKYVRTSARKARLVCDHIRGKDVEEARAILAFTPRHVAEAWTKLLESAVANAEHNHELVGDELRIASVHADEGPTLKRFRPRAMGRATKIRKRTSHLTITLTPKDQV